MLESFGYDLWLEKVRYIAPPKKIERNFLLLEKLKTFIELEFCKETKSVLTLKPADIRLLSKM